MLKRKLYNTLLNWKQNRHGTTAMLIDGARRVGKSFLCEQFARNEYKSYILIDFGNISKKITDLFEKKMLWSRMIYYIFLYIWQSFYKAKSMTCSSK